MVEIRDPEIVQRDLLTGGQKGLLDQIVSFISSRGFSPEQFGGSLPGPGAIEQLSLSALEDRARQLATGEGVGALTTQAQDVLSNLLGTTGADTEEFFRTTIQDPALQAFEEDILPSIGRRFGGQEFFSTERRDADAQAREDLLESLTRERSRVALSERARVDQVILQALGLLPSVQGADTAQLAAILGASGLARQPTVDATRFDFEKFLAQQTQQAQQIGQALASLGIQSFENIAFPGFAIQEEGGFQFGDIGGILGGIGGLASGISSIFSSEEYKEEFGEPKSVLEALEELNVKTWRYREEMGLGDDIHVGPMAENWKDVFPDSGDGKTIPIVDAIGVLIKGVQELAEKNRTDEILAMALGD